MSGIMLREWRAIIYLVQFQNAFAVRLVTPLEGPQLLKLVDDAKRLVLNILDTLLLRLELAPQIKGVTMGGPELVVALLATTTVAAPVGDGLLELVALELLLGPVLDGLLDGHVEGLAGLHEHVAELVGLVDRDARDAADEQLGVGEGGLAVAALEEDWLGGS